MGFYDNHNHSQFSFDGGRTSVEASARAARAVGLSGICFTDHCDFHVPKVKSEHEHLVVEVFDVEAQQAEIDRVRATGFGSPAATSAAAPTATSAAAPTATSAAAPTVTSAATPAATSAASPAATEDPVTGIEIFKGIEIGLYRDCRDQIKEHMSRYTFDTIIASVHYIDDIDPFYGGYYLGKTWKEAYGHYLETLYEEMVDLADFDIMGHFDYVARYAPYPQASILYRDFPDILDEMLKYLAYNGKALEINTKTYQDYNGRVPQLDENILLRFCELGGEMISLGSDSHDPSRPGCQFDRFAGLVRSCGFRYLTHFSSRRPILLPI